MGQQWTLLCANVIAVDVVVAAAAAAVARWPTDILDHGGHRE